MKSKWLLFNTNRAICQLYHEERWKLEIKNATKSSIIFFYQILHICKYECINSIYADHKKINLYKICPLYRQYIFLQ